MVGCRMRNVLSRGIYDWWFVFLREGVSFWGGLFFDKICCDVIRVEEGVLSEDFGLIWWFRVEG